MVNVPKQKQSSMEIKPDVMLLNEFCNVIILLGKFKFRKKMWMFAILHEL